MQDQSARKAADGRETHELFENVACPFCGMLCDDLEIENTDGTLKVLRNGCGRSISGFERKLPSSSPQISGKDVTNEWLTAVLCRDAPGAQVVGFSNPDGSSGSTERLALRVSYNDAGQNAGLPTELFTKAGSHVRQRLLTKQPLFLLDICLRECAPSVGQDRVSLFGGPESQDGQRLDERQQIVNLQLELAS